jgi:CHAD domain-containing protein
MRSRAAEHLIRQRVTALGRALPAARDGDVTSLHQARVATRRLRAALPLVAEGRKAQKLARKVRRLTRALGPVRELDAAVLILNDLEKSGEVPRPAIQRLRTSIGEERRLLQSDLRRRIEEFDLDRVRRRVIAVARNTKGAGNTNAFDPKRTAAAKARLARRAERLAVAIDNAAGLYLPDRLHDVRIAVKKLRYTLELSQSVSGSRATARLRALKTAQDQLGRMHDLEVLIARSRSLQSSPGASTLKVSSDLDRLVRRLENECRQLHGHYMTSRKRLLSICHRLSVRHDENGQAKMPAA